jgi:hypothetical protein
VLRRKVEFDPSDGGEVVVHVDVDKLFADLPADPYQASYELMQRVQRALANKTPSDADYTEACGFFEAFYEMNNWKIPPRINPGGYSSSDSADEV